MRDDERDDGDALGGVDLSAWQAPPPPPGLADRVVARLGEPEAVAATELPQALDGAPPARSRARRWALGAAAGGLVAAGALAVVLPATGEQARPTAGELVAITARHLSLGGVHADADPGAELAWQRDGRAVRARQTRGTATWVVDADHRLDLALGEEPELASSSGVRTKAAPPMALSASDARVRVEVEMHPSDARVLKASALTSAAVALATVMVYEGHVKATSGGVTVNLGPGELARLAPGAAPAAPELVGARPAEPPADGELAPSDAAGSSRAVPKDAVVRIDDCDPGAGTLELYKRPTSGQPGQPELVAVGVYEAQGGEPWWAAARREAGGEEPDEATLERHRNTHRLQRATVRDRRATPHLLVLTSYEPTEWHLDLRGANVTRVVVQGYHRSSVVGAGAVPVDVRAQADGDEGAAYAYQTLDFEENRRGASDDDWAQLNRQLAATYGAPIAHFAGCYQGSQVVVQ